jgi:uncharacterized membrane protein
MSQENVENRGGAAVLRTSLDEEIAVEIERPSEEVWAFVTNFERLPEWLDEFEAVVKESDGPMSRGTVFRYTLSPGSRSATLEVVDWQPGRRLAWDGPRFDRVVVAHDHVASLRSPLSARAAPAS